VEEEDLQGQWPAFLRDRWGELFGKKKSARRGETGAVPLKKVKRAMPRPGQAQKRKRLGEDPSSVGSESASPELGVVLEEPMVGSRSATMGPSIGLRWSYQREERNS